MGFYQWSRGVQIRANLDLMVDWFQSMGLGQLATQFFQKLSAAVNLLATPKETLLQVRGRSRRGGDLVWVWAASWNPSRNRAVGVAGILLRFTLKAGSHLQEVMSSRATGSMARRGGAEGRGLRSGVSDLSCGFAEGL